MINLTPLQKEHYKSIRWFVSEDGRHVGRSYLIAVALIEEAFCREGRWVEVFDHYSQNHECKRHTLSLLCSIFEENCSQMFKIEVQPNQFRFKIVRLPLEERIRYEPN